MLLGSAPTTRGAVVGAPLCAPASTYRSSTQNKADLEPTPWERRPFGHLLGDLRPCFRRSWRSYREPMSSLLVGTDEHVLASTSSAPGSVWHPVTLPAGVQHAVPAGGRLALCGVSPAIIWQAVEFTGRSEACPECLFMSAKMVTP